MMEEKIVLSSFWIDYVYQGSTIFTFLSTASRVACDRAMYYSNLVYFVPHYV